MEDPCRLALVCGGIVIVTFAAAMMLAGTTILNAPQVFGPTAACIPPIAAAILTRRSPTWVRMSAPGLASLFAGPPLGMTMAMPLAMAVSVPLAIALLLRAADARRYHASPDKDRLFLPILGTAVILTLVPMFFAMTLDHVDASRIGYVYLMFGLIAASLPVVLGCIAAWLTILIERRVLPLVRRWTAEARRCAREQR